MATPPAKPTRRERLLHIIGLSLPFFLVLWVLVFVATLLLGSLYYAGRTAGGLYLVTAETSRFEYKVTLPDRSLVYVDAVLVRSGDNFVMEADAEGIIESDFCFSGYVRPSQGVFMEFGVSQARQRLRIYRDGDAPQASVAPLAVLELSDQPYVLWDPANPRVTAPAASGLVLDQEMSVGDLALQHEIEITNAPDCFEDGTQNRVSFAPRSEPISIDGPGHLGRSLMTTEDLTAVRSDEWVFIEGEIDILLREVLCWQRLSLSSWNTACTRLFRTQSDPMPIPSGSALVGHFVENGNRMTSDLLGQAYFDGEMYRVNISTEAEGLSILRPGAGANLTNSNSLSVSLFERLSLEPLLVAVTTLFIGLTGLIVGVLQIESDAELRIGVGRNKRRKS